MRILITVLAILLISSFCLANDNPNLTIQQMEIMPLAFTQNNGQWNSEVAFRANAGGATMWFTQSGAVYQFTRTIKPDGASSRLDELSIVDKRYGQDDMNPVGRNPRGFDNAPDSIESISIKASFVNANPGVTIKGTSAMEYKCNYFIGNDPNEWHTDVPNYSAVIYEDIYDGIDLKYYGNGSQMEYDFIVEPGADFSQIKIQYDGAESVSINADGELVVTTKWGEVIEQKPIIYQLKNGSRVAIEGKYSMKGASALKGTSTFGFELSSDYDPTLPLVIDPVLSYSTYLGGSNQDWGEGIAVDSSGSAYVTGHTLSTDFPTQNPYQTDHGGGDYDVFVTKLSSSGNSLVYSTYLGGSSSDLAYGIAVDGSGSAYLAGSTSSTDFPTQNPYQTDQGYEDVFVTKLSSSGNSLVYSTYLGGSGYDIECDIAVDGFGSAYVTGWTSSTDFPTQNPYQTYQGNVDVFITKLSSSGNSLVYSTYLGESGNDYGRGIAVDGSGSAYVTGWTSSTDFPTQNPYQADQGTRDVFVTKLSSSGNSLVYSTYLGGSGNDYGRGIAVDSSGSAYVTGHTLSTDFPTQNPYQTDQGGGDYDVFVTKLSSSGSSLVYSTYLGGNGNEAGYGIVVDGSGSAYLTGATGSSDFPAQNPYQTDQGGSDAFVTKLSSSGNSLAYSTYLGGNISDYGRGIAVDGSGSAYLTGYTESTDFPTQNPYQTYQGSDDIFISKLTDTGTVELPPAGWSFEIRTGSSLHGLGVTLLGLIDSLPPAGGGPYLPKNPLFMNTCSFPFNVLCSGQGVIPSWANGLQLYLSRPGYWLFPAWFVAAELEGDTWRLNDLGPWVSLNIGKAALNLPIPIDTTGNLDSVYTFVNLIEWINNPKSRFADEYEIIDGQCPDLPGYLIGTTPIEFDPTVGPDENPFSTTPLTGTLQNVGTSGFNPIGYMCGDANSDARVNVGDAVFMVNFVFKGGASPVPYEAGDVNCDDVPNVGDAVYLVNHIFKGGAAPCEACP